MDFETALANGQRLLESDPDAALRQAEALVRIKRDARVYRLAADACRRLGMAADAAGAELGAIEVSLSDPKLRKAAAQQSEGRSVQARKIAEDFLRAHPDDLLALTLAAEASISLWDLESAERALRSVLDRAPTFLRASMLLATCMAKQVRMRDAIAVLDHVVARKPDNLPALTHLAQLRAEVREVEGTVSLHEKIVSLEPGRPERWVNLAQHYRIVGRPDDSIRAFRRALAIDPSNGSAWWSLANYFPAELAAADEQAIRKAVSDRAGKIDEGALHLALGLLADRRGERAVAFDHFAAGKRIRLRNQPYDPEPITAAVDGVIDVFTPEFYDRRKSRGWTDRSPIFILGMPRSGTTLVERILGRHSKIEGAGELQIVPRLAEIARRRMDDDPKHYAALLERLSGADLAWVGERYIQASHDYRRTEKECFVDKNNLNWMQIGLILLALPEARIIDVRRGALDCCWANFKMLFGEGYPAANDLRHIGRFFRDYVRLLDAMKVAAPGQILSVQYEDIVEDITSQTRRMLSFLGLDYEPQCIEFHRAPDAVATASSEQVRRPLNREGMGSALPYRPWLGPLIEELGPLATGSS